MSLQGTSADETLGLLVQAVTRIETKLDGLMDSAKDHEDRIRALERKMWVAMGFASVAGWLSGHIDLSRVFGG